MICFRDRTWCASPNCEGECGRKPTIEIKAAMRTQNLPISWAYLCGEGEVIHEDIQRSMRDDA